MKMLAAGVAAWAAFASFAHAQDSSGGVELSGYARPICTLSGEGFTSFPVTSIQRTIDISNPQNFPTLALNFNLACSQNFSIAFIPERARFENIDVITGALQPAGVGDAYLVDGSPVPGFVGGVKYRLNAVLGGITLPSGAGPSYTSPGFGPGVGFSTFTLTPRDAPLLVTFDLVELPASVNLLAGEYRETITIRLTPQGV